MPPIEHEGDYPMTKFETEILRQWIAEGAKWPEGVTLKAEKRRIPEKVTFLEHSKRGLEYACLSWHGATKDKGELKLDSKASAMKDGENGVCIVPGKPLESSLYMLITLPEDHDDVMPPDGREPLTPEESMELIHWIQAGASFGPGSRP